MHPPPHRAWFPIGIALGCLVSPGTWAEPTHLGLLDWVNPATGCPSLLTATECQNLGPVLAGLPDAPSKLAFLHRHGIDLAYRLAMCDCSRPEPGSGPTPWLPPGPLARLHPLP